MHVASTHNISDCQLQLDPDCSSRPCGIDEVCVPGQFGQPSGGPGSCSYSCMKFSKSVIRKHMYFVYAKHKGAVHIRYRAFQVIPLHK